MKQVTAINFDHLDKINTTDFNKEVAENTKNYLDILQNYYNDKLNHSSDTKYKILEALIEKVGGVENFKALKNQNHNKGIEKLVIGMMSARKFVENTEYVERIAEPIYFEPDHIHGPLDYRSHFYSPVKHLFGYKTETLPFNLGVIWFMTFILYITLYFDLLRKSIIFTEGIVGKAKSTEKEQSKRIGWIKRLNIGKKAAAI
ncbi:MAG: hypothetical protein IH946_08170 [Bacteroidetes bacterium]|nr:hypothetical protein [Bacteroidota bacterium]